MILIGNIHSSTGIVLDLPFLTKRGIETGSKLYTKWGVCLGIVNQVCYNQFYASNIMIELNSGLHQSLYSKFITEKELRRKLHIRLIKYLRELMSINKD